MSRRNRLFIWLAAVISLLVLGYASLPTVLTAVVKQQLAARGLSDIQIHIDYPGWRGIRVHSLAFTAIDTNQQLHCEVPEVAVEYRLSELVTGSVAQIRIPLVAVRIKSIPGKTTAPSEPTSAAGPPLALLTGQWLASMPIRELSLAQLKIDGRTAGGAAYSLQLSGQLRDAQLRVHGDAHLPSPQKPFAFSFNTSHSGETHLSVSSIEKAAQAMITIAVKPVEIEQAASQRNPIKLNGTLTARLNSLLPRLAAGFTGMEWASGLEGDLNSQWQAQFTDANWRVTGEAAVQGLGGRLGEQALPSGELAVSFDVDPQLASFQTSLHLADRAVVLETKGTHQFTSGNGYAELSLAPVEFSDSGFVLSQLLESWPYPFDINAGRVSANGRLVWQQSFRMQGTVQLDKLGGHYNKMAFAGLGGEAALALDNSKGEGLHTSKDAQLHVDLLDVGFPLKKMALRFALAAHPGTGIPLVRIKKFSTELLGGRAHIGPFDMDFGREKNAFAVQLEQIGLDEIMLLEQQEGLEGSGKLDGRIPIEISSDDIVVTHGRLAARAPGGVIRYTPTEKVAAMAQSNMSVGIVVEALSNFHYKVLDVISDYKHGGDLVLQVRLEGRNPAWQAGKPVHLNLNVEENIQALLRSLQMSGDISERMRKHYENTSQGNGHN